MLLTILVGLQTLVKTEGLSLLEAQNLLRQTGLSLHVVIMRLVSRKISLPGTKLTPRPKIGPVSIKESETDGTSTLGSP